MHSTLTVVVAAAAFTMAAAKCPNLCSGHGSCSKDDKCLCWNGFTGADCSLRTCPQGRAWALDNSNPHRYEECANRGLCDRSTGQCKCFDGYEGGACERVVCPNQCSGHGMCRMAQDLPNYDPNGAYLSANTLDWEEDHLTSCVCDPGFFGPDCSMRRCPFGDDPVTVCDQTDRTEQVQQIDIYSRLSTDTANDGDFTGAVVYVGNEFSLSFKTTQGYNYSTESINGLHGDFALSGSGQSVPVNTYNLAGAQTADTTTASRIEMALEGLPNFVIQDVTVTDTEPTADDSTGLHRLFQVTFHHESVNQNSYGAQNLMECDMTPCPGAGCHPRTHQMYAVASLTGADSTAETTAVTAANYKTPDVSAKAYMRFHEDSVLQCPTGKTCSTPSTATTSSVNMMAGLAVAVIAPATELDGTTSGSKVFVYAYGNGDEATLTTIDSSWAGNAGAYLVNGASGVDPAATTTTVWDKFSYAGELTAANAAKFDISDFIPDTYLQFDAFGDFTSTVDYYQVFAFEPFMCSVSDITESGSPHKNGDAENIECSGRGECNRDAGVCECFSGYTGNSCSSQTVLV